VTEASRPTDDDDGVLLSPAAVRALRPPREALSPWRHQGVVVEDERYRDRARRTATVFLTGAECPFTCVFCDLWRHTVEGPTPPGALPAQLRAALSELDAQCGGAAVEQIKLYNASNFFEPRAVPENDDRELLRLLQPFPRVTVECHPLLVLSRRALARRRAFAAGLSGALEVAMGLETVHPRAVAALGKESDPATFAAACEALLAEGVDVRAFVLVGAPFVPAEEQVEWVVRSAGAAAGSGASIVSLIPVRSGNGALEALERRGEYEPVTLGLVERCFERALVEVEASFPSTAVLLDTWDLLTLARRSPDACSRCALPRVERLRAAARDGAFGPPVGCPCAGRASARGQDSTALQASADHRMPEEGGDGGGPAS
jgi:radical SAM enzyme (TIGR01210 family)